MATARMIADFTGFSRDAVTRRVRRFNLEVDDLNPKDILDLKPLAASSSDEMSLEEARTQQAIEDTALKRAQRMKIEEALAPTEELQAEVVGLFDGIGKIIGSSPLDEKRKEDLLEQMNTFIKENWGKKK